MTPTPTRRHGALDDDRHEQAHREHTRRGRRRAALREAGYLLALLLAAGVAYSALVLLPSKLETRDLRARHDALVEEVADLRAASATLRADARALEEDPWTVERALRARLGYLRQGERVFRATEGS